MKKLLQVDFDFEGPFGEEMASLLADLAESINEEPGFIWKIWTESQKDQLGGGIYLFEDQASAISYFNMHSVRLKEMGVENIRGKILDVNISLSVINNGPVA